MQPKLGILAGGGELPRLLVNACHVADRDVFVIAFKGQCDRQTTCGVDHAWVRLGAAGQTIQRLRDNGVEDLVMAGRIRRPGIASLMPDARALKILAGGVMNRGDDGLLRTIIEALEHEEGFHMVGVHDVMPELLSPQGVLGDMVPTATEQVDIDVAVRAALDLGAQDKGQAAVALGGHVVALEDQHGTDAMLKRLAGSGQGRGGVLAKMTKPGQERRADLPTIGPDTIDNAHDAGLKGIVLEAHGSLIVERDKVIEAANAKGVFVVGVKP